MLRSTVELDFFGLERNSSSSSSSSKSHFQKFLHRQRSFRDIQSAISKINPELLKSVIASGSANQKSSSQKSLSVPSSPKADRIQFPVLPVYVPVNNNDNNLKETDTAAPLTIFYNGCVSVFDVPRNRAESILKLALEGSSKAVESATVDPKPPTLSSATDQTHLLDNLNGDLPLARRKSLQRFLEKRKERMTFVSPYACHT